MTRFLLLSDPRSGSTFLANLLNSHPDVEVTGELLNEDELIPPELSALEHLVTELSKLTSKAAGVKVFPSQIFHHNLALGDVVQNLEITHIIVLWRRNFLETLSSMLIAQKTGVWYTTEAPTEFHSIQIQPEIIVQTYREFITDWEKIGNQWPVHVVPVFLCYEELVQNRIQETNKILAALSCKQVGHLLKAYCKRQNPKPLTEKVSNWAEIPPALQMLELDVSKILKPRMDARLEVSADIMNFLPDREPPPPHDGWRYRVAEPFIPQKLKENVYDAIECGNVSSATGWVSRMSEKLKNIFAVPVALPCSNGFTALMLAMQTVKLGKGNEVIVPSLTMVAVPNSVVYTGATPIFADSSPNNYNPGWAEIEQVATKNTKAVILTHTYGVPVPPEDLKQIVRECKSRGWWLIEDISECVGIKVETNEGEKFLGTFGDFACASLYANKIVHAGDGGFVLAKDASYSYRLKSLTNHGFTPSYHFVHFEPAINGKINGIGAAMAAGCLESLSHIMEHRAKLASNYRELLADTPLKLMPSCGVNDTPWVFGVECNTKSERTNLRAFLAKHGIETRDYFFPLHLQPAYTDSKVRLPNSEKLGSTGCYLPTFTNLRSEDIGFIAAVIQKFYWKCDENSKTLLTPPKRQQKERVLIKPGTFEVAVQSWDNAGGLQHRGRGHALTRAVMLGMQMQQCLIEERWDFQQVLLVKYNKIIQETTDPETKSDIQKHFAPYIEYINSQTQFETSIQKPWLFENLSSKEYEAVEGIRTTTDPETLQLLLWLVKTKKPQVIWEIGCWVGHTTARLAIAAKTAGIQSKIFACDGFKWQTWMENYLRMTRLIKPGDSFLPRFEFNTEPFSDVITSVEWPCNISELPEQMLFSPKPDIVFVDMSQEDSDLEHIWSLTFPHFIAGQTILVYNGLNRSSLPFFVRHADQLQPLAKPSTTAKAFMFGSAKIQEISKPDEGLPSFKVLPRKLCFHNSPGWNHHHKNAFQVSVDLLRKELHDDNATTLFVPAVEQTFCDNPELLVSRPWIGIIHSVVNHPEQFYTPDLERLCGPFYQNAMKLCKGLFTLTEFQTKYLRQNLINALPNKVAIPIQRLIYPMIAASSSTSASQVPTMWVDGQIIDFVLIGSFARDFQLFYDAQIPSNLQKTLLAGDWVGEFESAKAPPGVKILSRLNSEEYEKLLSKSIVFLSLKYEGAANTIILECINRNIPIVVPSMKSCTEYIGENYPLQYDHLCRHFNFVRLITRANINSAIRYLQNLNKSKFQPEKFVTSVKNSSVLLSVSPTTAEFPKFDVTVSICSFRRTHNVPKILAALWNDQDFKGRLQIIVWDNNEARSAVIHDICKEYLKRSSCKKSLEVINSTENYYCAIRLALPALMKSDALLICDDDVIPKPNFISFFTNAHRKYRNDVLCLRGHVFLPHELDLNDPTNVWTNYESLRFKSDDSPEQFIHFVHADACLIPRRALREVASVDMPDSAFSLVDDYWLSFLLNHKFKRNLRKLTTSGLTTSPVERTDDSDTIGLALHTRPEVRDARLRLYLHHMLQGWPTWPEILDEDQQQVLRIDKKQFWTKPFIGFNVSSRIGEKDVQMLHSLGIQCVRIGAVGANGIGPGYALELQGLVNDQETELAKLVELVDLLDKYEISVVITLQRSLANPCTWKAIATALVCRKNVVGYDLINEPFTKAEKKLCSADLANLQLNRIPTELLIYSDLIKAVREVDFATPIVIESSFWGHIDALRLIPLKLLEQDSNLLLSFHFYEPRLFTQRKHNKNGKFLFPGEIAVYEHPKSETIYWDREYIRKKFLGAQDWAQCVAGVQIHVAEVGVCRDIDTADEYLQTILNVCVDLGLSGFLFSFRDECWDAMNYEFGQKANNFKLVPVENNVFLQIVRDGVSKMKAANRVHLK